jgi:hypothetical protein
MLVMQEHPYSLAVEICTIPQEAIITCGCPEWLKIDSQTTQLSNLIIVANVAHVHSCMDGAIRLKSRNTDNLSHQATLTTSDHNDSSKTITRLSLTFLGTTSPETIGSSAAPKGLLIQSTLKYLVQNTLLSTWPKIMGGFKV